MAKIDNEVQVLRQMRAWVGSMVIGLKLCPFARPVEEGGRLRYAVCLDDDPEAAYQFYLRELQHLVDASQDVLETSLLVFPNIYGDFDDYLDFVGIAEDCIVEAELEGVVQVASFHPDYYFEDSNPDDVTNFTNRSPYPVLHLLREDSLSAAIDSYPDVDGIPERNMRLMRELGLAKLEAMLVEIRNA